MNFSNYCNWGLVLLSAATVTVLSGCKSPPAEESVYIPPEYAKMMEDTAKNNKDLEERTGFHRMWGKPAQIRQFDKVKVAVVISPKQLQESWWARQNVRNLVSSSQDDLQYVAEYARESFKKAFAKSKHFKLADQPGAKTMALEFAIVQLVPNKPILGAVSNLSSLTPIGLLILPLKTGAKGAGSNTGGAIAMESVLRNSQNGDILAVFADREKGKAALFNAKEFTAYANVRAIIDRWTADVVIALDQVKDGKKVNVKDEGAFTLIDF